MKKFTHQPVLVKEVEELLCPKKGKVFVDGTVGLGGHSKILLSKGARIIAIDKDDEAIKRAKKNLKSYQKIEFQKANFADIDKIIKDTEKVDGILLDLGTSSVQLDDSLRGFSFKSSSLDMRMDKSKDLTAAKVINEYSEEGLVRIFSDFGEERYSKRIARTIVGKRLKREIASAKDLVEIIRSAVPAYAQHKKTHFATNIFRALRMEVNNEVDDLIKFLSNACEAVKPKGIVTIITFHSIEDRIVKRGLKRLQLEGKVKILTKKPIVPQKKEIIKNPRSRSAKLRACKVE